MSGSAVLKLAMLFAGAALACSAAQAMDAQNFYLKGSALHQQGPRALLTPDFALLKAEMDGAIKSVTAENDRARQRGKPLYCAPGKPEMSAADLLAEFRRIPAERRKRISVRQALREIAIRRFPC